MMYGCQCRNTAGRSPAPDWGACTYCLSVHGIYKTVGVYWNWTKILQNLGNELWTTVRDDFCLDAMETEDMWNNNVANWGAVQSLDRAIRWQTLENLSTMVRITDFPWETGRRWQNLGWCEIRVCLVWKEAAVVQQGLDGRFYFRHRERTQKQSQACLYLKTVTRNNTGVIQWSSLLQGGMKTGNEPTEWLT